MLLTKQEKNLFKHKKIIIFFVFAGLALFYWPASLYGNSEYILLFGDSMLPTIQPGSLVIVKPQELYQNGEIIAFENSGGTKIVHRIIEINDDTFVTQGDNNSFKDAPITQDVIIGKSALVVPYLAYLGLFMQTPIGLAMLGVFTIIMIIPKSKSKSKLNSNSKIVKKISSKKIVLVALIINGIHYAIEQIALGMNLNVTLTFDINLETSFVSTLLFAMWTFIFIVLYLVAKRIDTTNPKGLDPLKMVVIGSCMLIISLKFMLAIPLIVNILGN